MQPYLRIIEDNDIARSEALERFNAEQRRENRRDARIVALCFLVAFAIMVVAT